jgi:hypothetical protein
MAAMSSGEGPFGPGSPRRFGEDSCRNFRFTNAAWKARRVEGRGTTAMRINRLVGALLLEQNDEWQLKRRYLQLEGLQSLAEKQTARLSAVVK